MCAGWTWRATARGPCGGACYDHDAVFALQGENRLPISAPPAHKQRMSAGQLLMLLAILAGALGLRRPVQLLDLSKTHLVKRFFTSEVTVTL
jgi:hypothetical protein